MNIPLLILGIALIIASILGCILFRYWDEEMEDFLIPSTDELEERDIRESAMKRKLYGLR